MIGSKGAAVLSGLHRPGEARGARNATPGPYRKSRSPRRRRTGPAPSTARNRSMKSRRRKRAPSDGATASGGSSRDAERRRDRSGSMMREPPRRTGASCAVPTRKNRRSRPRAAARATPRRLTPYVASRSAISSAASADRVSRWNLLGRLATSLEERRDETSNSPHASRSTSSRQTFAKTGRSRQPRRPGVDLLRRTRVSTVDGPSNVRGPVELANRDGCHAA